jgi:hypothetical protein
MKKTLDWLAQAYQLICRAAFYLDESKKGSSDIESVDQLRSDLWLHADAFVDPPVSMGQDKLYLLNYNLYDVCGCFVLNKPLPKFLHQKKFLVKQLKDQFFKNDIERDVEWSYHKVDLYDLNRHQRCQLNKKTFWRKIISRS